jgi:hypothetical protein
MDLVPNFGAFTLFLGVALSITAFPVLARILAERKLLNTEVQNKSHLHSEHNVVYEYIEVEIDHLTAVNGHRISMLILKLK